MVNLTSAETGEDLAVIQNKLDERNQEFDRLLLLVGDGENEILERKLQQISDEILLLKQQKKRVEQTVAHNKNSSSKVMGIIELISDKDLSTTEYSDTLTYRIIEQITVLSKDEIRIRFVGGYEITQLLN